MLEIIALVALTKTIGEMVEKKGYKSGGYKVLTVVLWLGGEFIGAFMAAMISGGGDSQCVTYIVALIGAAIGAGIAYAMASSLPVREGAQQEAIQAGGIQKSGSNISAPLLFFLWLVSNILGSVAWTMVFSIMRPREESAFLIANIISLIASGLVIGALQWFLLTLALPNANRGHLAWWILATLIGPLINASLSALIGYSSSSIMALLFSIFNGAVVGGLQWIILQRYSKHALWWIAANIADTLMVWLFFQLDIPLTNFFTGLLLNIAGALATSIAIVLILKTEKSAGENAAIYGGTSAPRGTLTERDNRGTRHDTESKASAYWMARITSPKKDPFVLYSFDTEQSARSALLELPCIKVAGDTGNLICTEVLTFGYYDTKDGKYEAILCGDDLSHELWEQAKNSFVKHGGKPRGQGELEPERRAHVVSNKPIPGSVSFVKEEKMFKMGSEFIYRIYQAPDAASAQAFLEQHPVTQKLLYLIINTPEGTYCRDIDGMYKE